MHPIIALEGVDASGKSVVGKRLAILQSGVCLKTPLEPFNDWRPIVDQSNDYTARFYFYLAAVVSASAIIANHAESSPVIIDRWIWSTFANHQALGVDTSIVSLEHLPIIRPNHVFLLTVDPDTQRQRLGERNQIMVSNLEKDQLLQSRVLEEFRLFNIREIDTTHRNADATAKLIKQFIDKGG